MPTETKIDLQPFCDRDTPNMKQPFRIGDYVYATDGRIAVRVLFFDYPETHDADMPRPQENH